jgi:secreted trypsin-like serine protease
VQLYEMAFRVVFLLALALAFADARPSTYRSSPLLRAAAGDDIDLAVIGGTDAEVGAWPWQLSQQRLSSVWSHSCGASLLSSRYALSAAHCVEGKSPSIIRVYAGLHDRTDTSPAQLSYVDSYVMHERYTVDPASYSNDIAILTLTTEIVIGGNVGIATLPLDDNSDFAGEMCVITGWGRTSSDDTLPDILQQADIGVISETACTAQIGRIGTIWEKHICIYDVNNVSGTCNGDSGGPLNCPDGAGGYYVTGIASWVVSSGGACQVTYPSVYTRVSSYLDWINTNTP